MKYNPANSFSSTCLLLSLLIFLFSCQHVNEEKAGALTGNEKTDTTSPVQKKRIDYLEPDPDTLPNGIRLLDNTDSMFSYYYKEVVGSDTLKGGYILCYGINDSMKYFYVRHGKEMHLLNRGSIGTSSWGLGVFEKDLGSYFMIKLDNGNGCPPSYQLFDKKTGKNLLGKDIVANDVAWLKNDLYILYDEGLKQPDLTLMNMHTRRKEYYEMPDSMPSFWSVEIDKITSGSLRLFYSSCAGELYEEVKVYKR